MAAWWTSSLPVVTLLVGWWLNRWATRRDQERQRTWDREDVETAKAQASIQAEIAALSEARRSCITMHLTAAELLGDEAHSREEWHRYSIASAALLAALSLVDHDESRSMMVLAAGADADALALKHDSDHHELELPGNRQQAFHDAMQVSGARIRKLQRASVAYVAERVEANA